MTSDNPAAAPSELIGRLAVGEKLIWWDRPIPALMGRREFQVNFLFSGFFLAFSIFWITAAAQAPGVFFLFGIPFVLFGLWMVTTPLRSYYKASSILYALTDRRALILSGSAAKTFLVEHIQFVETESFKDGSGHVEFYRDFPPPVLWAPNGLWLQYHYWGQEKSGFIAIRDAENVYRALLDQLEKRNPTTAHGMVQTQ